MSQQFTWTASSPSGYGYLTGLLAAIGNFGGSSCFIIFNPYSNVLQLADNGGNFPGSNSLIVGSPSTVGNSQCNVYGGGSSVNRSGNQLALTVSVTFQPAYAGAHNQYLWAVDQTGLSSDIQQVGTWTVSAAQQYSLTTAVSPSGSGTLTFNPPCCTYAAGTPVTITASPAGGYQFSSFNGVDSSSGSTGYVTMNANRSVTATFTASPPNITGISPTSGTVGTQVTISGTGFIASGAVSFAGTPVRQIDSWNSTSVVVRVPEGAVTGTISLSSGTYQASSQQQFQVTSVTVSVNPPNSTISAGYSQQFTATVTNTGSTGVTWSKNGSGSINSNGVYTAPASVPSGASVTITATSVVDNTKQGSVWLALQPSASGFSIGVPADIDGTPLALYAQPGNSVALYITTSPTTPASYTFSSTNPGITVSAPSGSPTRATVTVGSGVAPGTYTIGIQTNPAANNQPLQIPITVLDATTDPMTGLRPNSQTEINMGFLLFASKAAYWGQSGGWYDTNHDVAVGDFGTVASPLYPVLDKNCIATQGPDGKLHKYVRTCIRQILAKYAAQGITGVRFQFPISDALMIPTGIPGTPATDCAPGQPAPCIRPQWVTEVGNFFNDLQEFGIVNITPTLEVESALQPAKVNSVPVDYSGWWDWDATSGNSQNKVDGDRYKVVYNPAPQPNCGAYPYSSTFRFSPTSPYGERCKAPANTTCDIDGKDAQGNFYGWDIDRGTYFLNGDAVTPINDSYKCSPKNPIFVGWPMLESVTDKMLQLASQHGLTAEELDARNEIDLEYLPVRARLIFDTSDDSVPSPGRDVLAELQNLMSNRGFRPDRVTYSAMDAMVNVRSVNAPGPGDAVNAQVSQSVATFDCTSLWGDSAREHGASQLLSAIGGGVFGLYQLTYGAGATPDGTYGLPCIVAPWESLTQDQITARITGIIDQNRQNNANPMAVLPVSHIAPSILDVHTSPCINVGIPILDLSGNKIVDYIDGNGVHYKMQWDCDPIVANVAGLNGAYMSNPGQSEVAQTAMVQFNALNSILASFAPGRWRYGNPNNANLANAMVMLGESYGQLGNTRGVLQPGSQSTGCKLFGSTAKGQQTPWEKLRENAFFIAAGFNLSNLACTAPNNCLSAVSKTTFRPWEYLVNQPDYLDAERQQPDPHQPDTVSCEPVVINLPFTPNNPLNR